MKAYFTRPSFFIFLTVLLFLVSFLYAVSLLPTQLNFYFDQARDAYEAYSIYHLHHLKILGPSSDVPGFNHGVLWYYLLAVFYFIGRGIPENAAYVHLILLYLSSLGGAYVIYKMTKSVKITGVTLSLYVFSPLYFSFSHWLSNPVVALYIMPWLLYTLWKFIHHQTVLLALFVGLLFGLLIQTDVGFGILLLLLPVYYVSFKIKPRLTRLIFFLIGLLITTSTFFLSYLKFHINILRIILSFLLHGSGQGFSLVNTVLNFFTNLLKFLSLTYLPLPKLFIVLLVLLIVIVNRSFFRRFDTVSKFLLLWLIGVVLIFLFNHGSLSAVFLYAPFLFPLAAILALLLVKALPRAPFLLSALFVIILLQLLTTHSWSVKGNSPLAVQQGMTTNIERQIVTYTYASAKGKPFVIDTMTNPLFINTTWSYLYEVYGKGRYGYVPSYFGKDQTGYLGTLPLQKDLKSPLLRYLILEPQAGINPIWRVKFIYDEDKVSDLLEEKHFGEFTVQKRFFHENKGYVAPPEILKHSPDILTM